MAIQVQGYAQKFVETRSLRFSYLEWGSPASPYMVLLHGITGFAHMWDVFAAAFQDEYHIFVLDQRGHGDTQRPDPPSYNGDDYVEDLAALTRLWGIDRFVLIGLSMGAHNGLAFASKYADRVIKLVAIDHPPEAPPPFRQGGDGAARAAVAAETVFNSKDEMFGRRRELNPIASDDMLRYLVEHGARKLSDGRWMNKYSPDAPRLWQAEDLWEKLPKISCPTLVVRGGESTILAPDVAEKEAAAIRNGQLITIAGSGHPVPMDKPVELEAAVRAFLTE